MEDLQTEQLTGYATADTYFASRFTQGTRKMYSLDLSIAAVAALLPRPDPDHPSQGNRRVDPKHAHDFAGYLREKTDWVSPAIVLRAPNIFEFDQKADIGGSQFGVLSVPRVARTDLGILDGQHRILGIHMAVDDIARELEQARQLVTNGKREGDDPALVAHHEATVKKLLGQRERFGRERISVQIVLEDDERGYKQMFVDIAENAQGITKTLQARFDSRKVVNRAMLQLVQVHPLLMGRVEEEKDQVTGDSKIVSAKHVTEIIRAAAVGLGRRISKKQEEALDEAQLVSKTSSFLTVLADAFPEIKAIQDGNAVPGDLRRTSMLGSATMLRVLAVAYHELTSPSVRRGGEPVAAMAEDQVVEFLTMLGPYLAVPVTDSLWTDTNLVEEGASAPRARGGDIRNLAEHLVGWAREGRLPAKEAA